MYKTHCVDFDLKIYIIFFWKNCRQAKRNKEKEGQYAYPGVYPSTKWRPLICQKNSIFNRVFEHNLKKSFQNKESNFKTCHKWAIWACLYIKTGKASRGKAPVGRLTALPWTPTCNLHVLTQVVLCSLNIETQPWMQ